MSYDLKDRIYNKTFTTPHRIVVLDITDPMTKVWWNKQKLFTLLNNHTTTISDMIQNKIKIK